jgi:hypothetical protein
MQKRTSVARHKPSSISRTEARKAVLGVKSSRASGARKTATKSKSATPSIIERYLGHFGVGSSPAVAKRGSGAKKAGTAKKSALAKKPAGGKRASAKKVSSTRSLRRAS